MPPLAEVGERIQCMLAALIASVIRVDVSRPRYQGLNFTLDYKSEASSLSV